MVYCMQCGKGLNDDSVFCTECGKRLKPLEAPRPADEQAPEPACDPVMSEPGAKQPVEAPGPADEKAPEPACDPMVPEPEAKQPAEAPEPADEKAPEPTCDPVMAQSVEPPLTGGAQPFTFAPAAAAPFTQAPPAAPYSYVPYRGVFPEAEPVEPASSKTYARNRKAVSSMYSGNPRKYTFLNTGLGLIMVFLLLSTVGIFGVATPMFFEYMNLMNVVKQCGVYALVAMAVVLSMRAKGIDLSIGPMMGMSAVIIAQTMQLGSPLLNGVLLAAAAALVLGLINGFAAAFLKVPAFIVTLVSGFVVAGVSMALTQGQMLAVTFSERVNAYGGASPVGLLILLGAVFVFVFVYNLLSQTGRPMHDRENANALISYIFAYVASAGIAAAAGFAVLVRLQTAAATLGMGYEAFIVFVFALLTASKALDNRFFPAPIALAPAMIWGMLTNIFALWGVITYYQPVVYGGLALVCLLIAFICRYEKRVPEYIKK